MNNVLERCCGLDVHKNSVVACIMVGSGKNVKKEIRKFETMTEDIRELANWLKELSIKEVVVESTGVYWKPIFNILEQDFDVTLANAAHVKNIPGRKTDVKDSEWLCTLLKHGLVKKSFIPPVDIRHLRELTRYRKSIIRQLGSEKNRIIKLLESANIKLASVLSDVYGCAGWQTIQALASGIRDPKKLVARILNKTNLKTSRKDFLKALNGTLTDGQVKLLALMVQSIIEQEKHITNVEQQMFDVLKQYQADVELLESMPGVGKIVAATIVAEIGTNMDQFPSDQHIASWAGLSPRNNESAGIKKGTHINPGNKNLKTTLVEAAWAATRTKGSFIRSTYHRLKKRIGAKRSLIAIARKMLVSVYWMLRQKVKYRDLGENYVNPCTQERRTEYYKKQLTQLGFEVLLTPKSA